MRYEKREEETKSNSPQYVSSVVVVGLGFRRFGDIGFRTPREEWLGFKTQYLIDG